MLGFDILAKVLLILQGSCARASQRARLHMQTNLSRTHTLNHLLYGALTLCATIHLPYWSQGQISGNQGQPFTPEPAGSIQTRLSWPCLTHSLPTKPEEGSCPHFPSLPLTNLLLPRVNPDNVMSCPFLLGAVRITNFFNGNHLLISPCLKNNTIYGVFF